MKVELNSGRLIKPYNQTDISGVFELTKYVKKRTNPQNAWIHGFLFPPFALILTRIVGKKVSSKLAKGLLKKRCGLDYVQSLDDWVVTPTSEMSTVRMVKFIEDSLAYIAVTFNEYLEGPNEEQWRQIKDN
jgi:hypothetical protein